MNNKFKKIYYTLVFLLIALAGFGQENKLKVEQKLGWGAVYGVNHAKLHNDTVNFNYGTRLAIGGYMNYITYKRTSLKASILYSAKGSTSVAPFLKIINTYIDFNLVPQYKLCDGFFIQSGISYSNSLFSKMVILKGINRYGVEKTLITKAPSEISGIIGIEFRLHNNLNIAFNYFIPISNERTKNFQITLNYCLNNKESKKQNIIRQKKRVAEEQIKNLKQGTLLVRLKTSELKINALIKMGDLEEASKVKKAQDIENKKIVAAFKNNFNFCKTVFFFSNNSDNVRKGNCENIFLNDSLIIDEFKFVDTSKSIFIAEFGTIEQDTLKHFSHYTYEPDGDWSVKKVSHYYGGPDFGFDALIIRDKNFVQLSKPFPYYTRAIFKSLKQHPIEALFIAPILVHQSWSYNQTVKKMNWKLIKYFDRHE